MEVNSKHVINKTMDIDDLYSGQALAIVNELNGVIKELREKKLKISSWYGKFDLTGNLNLIQQINRGYDYKKIETAVDDKYFPWFLYWEIIWIVLNSDFKPEDKVLDLGGSSSLFTYYLASKGVDVTSIELKKELVDNGNFVAQQMGWNLKNYVMDIREMKFNLKFDHMTSICVYEHIPVQQRIKINKNIKELLVKEGKFSITFDYRNPSKFAGIRSEEDIYGQFVKTSGLKIRGNKRFFDNGKNYLLEPFYYKKKLWKYKLVSIVKTHFKTSEFFKTKNVNDYTFGAFFMEKA